MAASAKRKHKEERPTGSIIALVIVFGMVLGLLVLTLRGGKVIEKVDEPSLSTIDTCGAFCKGQCVSSLYDKMRAELFVEDSHTYCVCTCNSTLHTWVVGE